MQRDEHLHDLPRIEEYRVQQGGVCRPEPTTKFDQENAPAMTFRLLLSVVR